jgi:hypothetical protein
LGFANATSLARMRLPKNLLAALAIQIGFASRVALFQMFRKMYVYFLGTFFIVSILIAGMASKQGTINFGQKRKAPDNLFVNNVSVPRRGRRGRATPPFQASLALSAILSLLLFLFLPHSFIYAPSKNIAQFLFFALNVFFAPKFAFCSQIILLPNFLTPEFLFCSQNLFFAPNYFWSQQFFFILPICF